MSAGLKRLLASNIDRLGTRLLSPPHGGAGYYRNHGPRDRRRVAITFDDGPSRPASEALLDAMEELAVVGTFFWVGVNMTWHPDLIARADRAGHVIGNHSMHHSRKAGLKPTGGAHIDDAATELAAVLGRQPRLYRPPWGWLTPWEGRRLSRRGYTIVGWDVYTLDWQWPEPDGRWMAEQARREVQPGSIILFHDGNAGVREWDKKETIRAVRHLVPALRADGYELVTAAELLGVAAYDRDR